MFETKTIQFKAELESELHNNILNYWQKYTIDNTFGGFIGTIDYNNRVLPESTKGVVLNARILWTFASAYRMFRHERYLKMANRAFAYISEKFIDKKYGGVYWELDHKGKPLNTRKQIYGLSFVIYGMVEFYRVNKNREALSIATQLFSLIEKYSFDKQQNGYVEAFSCTWNKLDDYRLSEKDSNESKTMNTHLHILEAYTNLFRVWKSKALEQALTNLIELFIEKFINENRTLNLFFDDAWQLKSNEISFGHDIECAWLLYEAAEVLENKNLIKQVSELSVQMTEKAIEGLDADGGLMNEKMLDDNTIDTDKHWWPQAEAMVGFFNAYQLSNKKRFKDKMFESWSFIKQYIIDDKNGEWFGRVNKQGVPYKNDVKAGFWKCPYHNGRACMEIIERLSNTN